MPTSSHVPKKRPPLAVFLATFVIVFFCTLFAADSIGFVPYYIDGIDPTASAAVAASGSRDLALSDLPQLGQSDPPQTGTADAALAAAAEAAAQPKRTAYPVRISIPSVGINLPVQNPSTSNVDALDALLVKGPARYVSSATLGEPGNIVIFAHSSHLPAVMIHNKMFQAFNNIPNLSAGDTITLTGTDGKDYLYSVDSVVRADTNDGVTIPLQQSGTKLTLVTCDTLTGKSARYILTADLVGTN